MAPRAQLSAVLARILSRALPALTHADLRALQPWLGCSASVYMAHLGVTMTPQPLLALLLIDDEPSFLRGLARLLRRGGYTVGTAAHGQSALPLLQEHPWDVILCDLRMPDLDGPDFYALLGRHYPALRPRVIFLTGDTFNADSRAFLAQCGQPWLSKPCTAAAVRRAIHQVLRPGGPANA